MNTLIKQIAKFTSVGVLATIIHVTVAVFANARLGAPPLSANTIAFVVATVFSLLGNWAWTFEGLSKFRQAAPRFLLLSTFCFCVNQTIVYAMTSLAHLPLAVAMVPVVLTIPPLTFWLSKTRVFTAPHVLA